MTTNYTKRLLNDVLDLFYPRLCMGCDGFLRTNETYICLNCLQDLPVTNFFYFANPVEKIFYGRAPIASGTAYLYFSKGGIVQNLIHHIKYQNMPEVAAYVGQLFGNQMIKQPQYKAVKWVLPVPLHPKKLHKRGYNQSAWLASGISSSMGLQFSDDILVRTDHTSTQTKKSRFQRWTNVKDIFTIKQGDYLEGQQILLVDDVITTGATLEACIHTLRHIPGIQIHVATLAHANNTV